ncbi:MAG: nuclear transport factor 2 family protein [Hyphomonadaceae bacterium]|nr:nuclear transport factor 2 family protein [Hyphomonadaceae bacterium]
MTDEEAIGAVIDEMYAMISGPKGPRDWSRQARCFHPQARQMRTGVDDRGRPWMKIMSLEEYRVDTAPYFEANDFYEVEIERRIDVFGNVAQVRSVYEARRAPDDAAPERRGINMIHLYRQAPDNEGPGGGWRIVSMIWDNERPGVGVQGVSV